LILVIGLTHMYVFSGHLEAAKYIGMSLAALFAGTLLSALWILKGLRWAWILGSVLCAGAIVGYVVSRTWERLGVPLGYLLEGALGLPVLELDVRYSVPSSPSFVARGLCEDRFHGAASGPPSTRDPCYTGSAAPAGPSKSLQNLCAKTGDP
jgi:hypothetical protein